MPQHFFNLYNDITAIDDDGRERADDAAALEQAVLAAREVTSARVLAGHIDLKHHIIVLAENGQTVGTIAFGDAVTVIK